MKDTRRGRPSRAEASERALQDVDVSAVDPLDVLREIVADRSAPATSRVAAARALLAENEKRKRAEANSASGWPKLRVG
jgi:hypothetical protein